MLKTTAKTRYKRSKAKYDYPKVKARLRKQYRKKFKESISVKEINEIWRAYLEDVVISQLLKGKKVVIINGFEIEVIGRPVVENEKIARLFANGMQVYRNGVVKPATGLSKTRRGYYYKIECKNSNFKNGTLFFKANRKISDRLFYLLSETSQYFRIESNESK